MAIQVGRKSKCKKNKVGTVITDKYNRVISTGYNGSPKGTLNKCEDDNDVTYLTTIHSEQNAILFAKQDLEGCILYCTLSPCLKCAAFMVQAGISKVYYLNEYRDTRGIDYLTRYDIEVRRTCYKDLLEMSAIKLR